MDKLTEDRIANKIKEQKNLLLPTHNKLSLPIIIRIYRKMINGIKFRDIKVTDTLILDGHHRYVASIMAGIELGRITSSTTSATIEYDWKSVHFADEEWETKDKIKKFNQRNAEVNNVSFEFLEQLVKN